MKKIETAVSAVCIAVFIAVQTAFSAVYAESAPDAPDYSSPAAECFEYFSASPDNGAFWDSLGDSNADWAAYCYARLNGSEGSEA